MKLEIVKCPACGAALTISKTMNIVNCAYCDATINVSSLTFDKNKIHINNLLDIAYTALENKDYDEAMDYVNNVLEYDARNLTALTGKALSYIKNFQNEEEYLEAGFNYMLKAISYGKPEEKNNIKQLIIWALLGDDMNFTFWHTDFLIKVFEYFDSSEIKLLRKIIEVCDNEYNYTLDHGYDKYAGEYVEKRDRLMVELKELSKSDYENELLLIDNRYYKSISKREKELREVKKFFFKKYLNTSGGPGLILTLSISLLFTAAMMPKSDGLVAFLFLLFSVIFFLVYLYFLDLYCDSKMANYESEKYRYNIVYGKYRNIFLRQKLY